MIRILAAAVIGAVVLMAWNFASWTVLKLHESTLRPLHRESVVVDVLREHQPEGGAYYFPALPQENSEDAGDAGVAGDAAAARSAWVERHRQGPVGMLIYLKDGADPLSPRLLVGGGVVYLLDALLAACLLHAAAGSLVHYGSRLMFVVGLGLFVSLAADLAYWNWAYFPTDYTISMVSDRVVGWLLVGLIMAAIVSRRPKA